VSGVGTTLVTHGGANEIVVGDAVGAASALTISNSAKVRTGALLLAPTGTVKVASAAVLTVQKSISGNGVIDIEAGGTLKALGTASANSTIDFAGASATLDIGAQGANVHSPHGFAARLNGFVAGDILAYQGALTKASFAHGQLTLSDGASVEAVLGIKGNFAANAFHLGTFSGGFTSIYVTA
jgi:hypothetical protein